MRHISFPFSQLSMEVQFSLAHHIQALVKPERNRQIVCEGGLVSTLLDHCRSMLMAPNHPLHLPVTRILEKLSSQAVTHSDFRLNRLSADTCISFFALKRKRLQYLCYNVLYLMCVCYFFLPQKVPVFR